MKLIVVNDGNISINADTVTKIEKHPGVEYKGSIFIHVKDEEERFLVGQYKEEHALEMAFINLTHFLGSDESGVFDCPNDMLLWASYPKSRKLF